MSNSMVTYYFSSRLILLISCVFRTDGKAPCKQAKKNSKEDYVFPDLSMNYEYGAMPVQRRLVAEIKTTAQISNWDRT